MEGKKREKLERNLLQFHIVKTEIFFTGVDKFVFF